MKQITVLLLAMMVVFAGCQKDEEENNDDTQKLQPTADVKGFSIEWTSITCGICGSTGGPLLSKFGEDGPNGAMIAIHVNSSDAMQVPNSVYFAFKEDRPSGGGIPSFWVGDEKISTSDENAVLDQVNGPDAEAGVALDYSINGNTMSIETMTKFFTDAQATYYLSVLVLEDGIDGGDNAPTGYQQAGGASDYKHNFVYRTEATPTMGEVIATMPDADDEISKNYTVELDSEWNNPYPVAIIYKYDANATVKYSYVNSYRK